MTPATPGHAPLPEVEALLARAARELVVPRFRQLKQADVEEKSPGEVVTIVDREVEALLAPALRALLPGSRVVGEEACALQPDLLCGLDVGDVWLVDPLDGTGNFIAGRPEIAIMVALLREGETVAAWMLRPMDGTMYMAQRGAGAWRQGRRVQVQRQVGAAALRGIVKTRFLPAPLKSSVVERCAALRELQSGANCTAVDYPDIVAGRSDFALYWRTLPWDHAPGVLFLQEAGGHVARLDGSPYRPADPGEGLLAAADHAVWTSACTALGF